MSKFGNAAFVWMKNNRKHDISTDELWEGLQRNNPELTTPSEKRKTPRTTCMRDLRKDSRFRVGSRRVAIVD